MFTLFKSSPKFPRVQRVDIKTVRLYISKFEESLRNFEELQKEGARF
jgi:D-aminopeptidase